MQIPGRKSESLVCHNTKVKLYPDGTEKIICCNRPIFRESGYEPVSQSHFISKPQNYNMDNPTRSDSLKRAKESVFDISALNEFEYFVTFTVSPENLLCINRYDPVQLKNYICKWFDNQVQRNGIRHVTAPENHEDCAIHLHGLISGISVVDSGTVLAPGYKKPIKRETAIRKGIPLEDCKTVYNVPSWRLGWSTAIALYGDSTNVAKYMTKYITKDLKKIFGKFYYSGGKGLVRKPPFVLTDMNFDSIEERAYAVEQAGLSFKYQTIKREVESNDTASSD